MESSLPGRRPERFNQLSDYFRNMNCSEVKRIKFADDKSRSFALKNLDTWISSLSDPSVIKKLKTLQKKSGQKKISKKRAENRTKGESQASEKINSHQKTEKIILYISEDPENWGKLRFCYKKFDKWEDKLLKQLKLIYVGAPEEKNTVLEELLNLLFDKLSNKGFKKSPAQDSTKIKPREINSSCRSTSPEPALADSPLRENDFSHDSSFEGLQEEELPVECFLYFYNGPFVNYQN